MIEESKDIKQQFDDEDDEDDEDLSDDSRSDKVHFLFFIKIDFIYI
jgi:hypothetical protein